ncbi:MAG: hypothetical protein QXH07_02045 [Thermoplasmata archaeon]
MNKRYENLADPTKPWNIQGDIELREMLEGIKLYNPLFENKSYKDTIKEIVRFFKAITWWWETINDTDDLQKLYHALIHGLSTSEDESDNTDTKISDEPLKNEEVEQK